MLDRVVTVKVINQSIADDPAYLEALQRETRLAAGLDKGALLDLVLDA